MPKVPETEAKDLTLVAAVKNHAPSVLNPDRLKSLGLVNEDLAVKGNITTELFSQVVFNNGPSVAMDPERIIVKVEGQDNGARESATSILLGLIGLNKGIEVRAVGVNPILLCRFEDDADAVGFLQSSFTMNDKLKKTGLQVSTVKFAAAVNGFVLRMSLEPGKKPDEKSRGSTLVFTSNYHRDVTPAETADIESFLKSMFAVEAEKLIAQNKKIVESFFE